MTALIRRSLPLLLAFVILIAMALPAGASSSAQGLQPFGAAGPETITGTFTTTNPIYPTIGAVIGVVLYDFAGQIQDDYNFVPPPDAQTLGAVEGDIASGSYTLTLPDDPQGTLLDFDGDASTPPGVQVFVTGMYIDFLGDEYVNRGESLLNPSANIQPMTYHVVGGHVLAWAAQDGEQFPAGLGADGAAFTADDPLMDLPAGWSVIDLDTDPFTLLRDETVDVPLLETLGALNDYSALSYMEAWQRLLERTRITYPFTDEKNIDFDAIEAEITPLVEVAVNNLDFHLAIARFGELIPDTHIGYASLPVMQNFLLGGVGIDHLAVTDDGEVVVLDVLKNMPAATAGIVAGDVLVKVDGVPALQAMDETPMLITSASTLHGRRFIQAATMLQGAIGSTVQLSWQNEDGTVESATLTRVPDASSLLTAFGGSLSGPVIDSEMLPSGIGYISVKGFAEEVSTANAQFTDQLQALVDEGAKGIILDVRDNGGGLVNLAMAEAGHFFPDYELIMDFYYADGEGGFAYRGFVETLVETPGYDGPVAVLVNEMTGSAGDMFAYAMSQSDRAIIVGHTPSGGFTGEVSDGQYTLPGGLQMQIPTGRPVNPGTGDTLIEGTGVVPDVRVPLTREGLLSPEDEVLQAAEDAILNAQ
ncbi:MAG TPA: S41 family peptidase [Aggregatilinea sp.]|uniref:S41 family peptidase n=1 Tax=Aggregatilinea sp. TaxID=2806333 RepID=UPI002C01BFF0|nr:S41 family peptidase [Aggregatilinea sp.]HML22308.1 S41 family peptidase [Aggregatilinea sp.]